MNRIIHLPSNKGIEECLKPDSVSLTITSPPYLDAIDYDTHSEDRQANYRTRKSVDLSNYWHTMEDVFTSTLWAHRPGTFCAVVIGTVLDDGDYIPLPFQFWNMMKNIGWQFHQDIIWSKVTGGVRRAGTAIQKPYPGYLYLNLMNEYILVFKKPGESKIYENKSQEEKEENANQIDSVFTRNIANSIWDIAPVPPNQYPHPCPFPEEIPHRLIRWLSYKGDLVLDPFSGIGTTCKVAKSLGRQWVGFETQKGYVDFSIDRITNEPFIPRKQLIPDYLKVEYGTKLPAKNPKRKPFGKTKGS